MGALYEQVKIDPSKKNFNRTMNLLTRSKRQLESVVLQLSPMCNFNCGMCYAKMTAQEIHQSGNHIRSFDEWKPYIDAIADMDVYSIGLTGGECTMHPDFLKIYSYAYDKGLEIGVLTNGSLISDEMISLWKEKPPVSVSMTIYGATPEKYKEICKNEDGFYHVINNIMKLKNNGIKMILKSTVIKENYDDILEIDRFCRSIEEELKITTDIEQYDNCSSESFTKHSLSLRNGESIQLLLYADQTGKTYDEIYSIREKSIYTLGAQYRPIERIDKFGSPCSAGTNSCYINWLGLMQPCVTFDLFSKDPKDTGFKKCWEDLVEWTNNIPRLTECVNCLHRYRCRHCIAMHYNDTGELGKVSPRLCWKHNNPEEAERLENIYRDNNE